VGGTVAKNGMRERHLQLHRPPKQFHRLGRTGNSPEEKTNFEKKSRRKIFYFKELWTGGRPKTKGRGQTQINWRGEKIIVWEEWQLDLRKTEDGKGGRSPSPRKIFSYGKKVPPTSAK